MRSAEVYRNGDLAGVITEDNNRQYTFVYNDKYYNDSTKQDISLTLPKTRKVYKSKYLFPLFFNMLSEGVNRKLQSRLLRVDENDHFGFLLATAQDDTIGAITIKPIEK